MAAKARQRFFLFCVSMQLRWRELCIRCGKRRILQVHLSTLVLIAFATGGTFWLNSLKTRSRHFEAYGFPAADIRIHCQTISLKRSEDEAGDVAAIEQRFEHKPVRISYRPGEAVNVESTRYHWVWYGAVIDSGFLLTVLLGVAVLCEWGIRKAAGRTGLLIKENALKL